MKKTLAIVAALAVSLFSVNAFAQEYGNENESVLFNHWSLGISPIGHGLGFQAAGTILPNLQIRLVYNTMHPYIGIASAILKNNPNVGSITPFIKDIPINQDLNGVTIKDLHAEAQIKSRELHLLVDFFPSDISNIHFTGGIIFDLSPNMIIAKLTPMGNDGSAILKPEGTIVEFGGVTPDPSGDINIRASYGLKSIRPYLGVGFGRPVDVQKRVSVNFDLGLTYIGGVHIYSEGYADSFGTSTWPTAKTVELNEEWCNNTKLPGGKTITQQVGAGYIEYLGMANTFPILPYMRLTIACRLF